MHSRRYGRRLPQRLVVRSLSTPIGGETKTSSSFAPKISAPAANGSSFTQFTR
jgi:hypothetical protein